MKTQKQHTTGPWNYRAQNENQFIVESSERSICWLDRHYDPTEANACLIASAPDLLLTLEKLLSCAEKLDQSATHEGLQNCEAIANAREAIRKAKGEA